MESSPRRRRALSTALAVLLALESVSAVAAAAVVRPAPVTHPLPAEAPAGAVLAAEATVAPAAVDPSGRAVARAADPSAADRTADAAGSTSTGSAGSAGSTGSAASVVDAAALARAASAARADARAKAAQPVAAAKDPLRAAALADAARTRTAAPRTSGTRTAARTSGFTGTNHVWIPELGISRSLVFFPCSRTRPPDNFMYRWGCSGANNVYIMGHASSVMRPLHDAYVSGRLHTGMKAYYADGSGTVRVYAVRWWKKTLPTTDAAWAWAPQSTPSMTLQTCVGSNSQYRLMVRLTEVGG